MNYYITRITIKSILYGRSTIWWTKSLYRL